LKAEEIRLEEVKRELDEGMKKLQQPRYSDDDNGERFVKPSHSSFRLYLRLRNYLLGWKEKSLLEEVQKILEPTTRTARVTPVHQQRRRKHEPQLTSQPTPSTYHIASMETPISRPIQMADYIPSVMKGVVLTSPHPQLPNLSTFTTVLRRSG